VPDSPAYAAVHDKPPNAAAVLTENARASVPPPHVLVHPAHPLHAPTQSTGHDTAALQVCDCVLPDSPPYEVVQDTPPNDAAVDCVNALTWLPPPQVNEQAPQVPQAPTQSTGHETALQVCDCVPPFSAPNVAVQDTPPAVAGDDCINVRAWLPPPQVNEQVPQLPHAPAQFPGQGAVLQA
jgi:hypothetical protein